ncbi:hypothetical protein ABIE06_001543 [Pantoea dispersa]|jgi:hypothetical protein|nr:hypothetical protein [Pantoea dispersa]
MNKVGKARLNAVWRPINCRIIAALLSAVLGVLS